MLSLNRRRTYVPRAECVTAYRKSTPSDRRDGARARAIQSRSGLTWIRAHPSHLRDVFLPFYPVAVPVSPGLRDGRKIRRRAARDVRARPARFLRRRGLIFVRRDGWRCRLVKLFKRLREDDGTHCAITRLFLKRGKPAEESYANFSYLPLFRMLDSRNLQ